MKMLDPKVMGGNMTESDLGHHANYKYKDEIHLLKKFFSRYPELKMMPVTGKLLVLKGGQMHLQHPASKFIDKYRKLQEKGYSEFKAFEMVGAEIQEVLTK